MRATKKRRDIFLKSFDWLYNEYVVLRKTRTVLAKNLGCSTKIVSTALRELGIPLRGQRQDLLLKDEQWLQMMYCEKKLSLRQIAEIAQCERYTVRSYLKRYGIVRRPSSAVKFPEPIKELRNKEWMHEQLVVQKVPRKVIANLLSCSVSTVGVHAARLGIISSRNAHIAILTQEWFEEYYVRQGLSKMALSRLANCSWLTIDRKIKQLGIRTRLCKLLFPEKEWFVQKYCVERISATDLAKMLGCSRSTLQRHLAKLGIRARNHAP